MNLVGILSIKKASELKYPYLGVIKNLSEICDSVLVGVDPRFEEDLDNINSLSLSNVSTYNSIWNDENIKDGNEIAMQMDLLVEIAKQDMCADWVIVLQADEFLLEQDKEYLKEFCSRAPKSTTGFSMERLYFWKDINTVREDWNADLVRMFRPGYFSFMAEGTDKGGMYSGPVGTPGNVVKLPFKIYHYSRVGPAEDIASRVLNLDGFFHPPDSLKEPVDSSGNKLEYDFKTRQYDNYVKDESPPEVEGKFSSYSGNHPVSFTND